MKGKLGKKLFAFFLALALVFTFSVGTLSVYADTEDVVSEDVQEVTEEVAHDEPVQVVEGGEAVENVAEPVAVVSAVPLVSPAEEIVDKVTESLHTLSLGISNIAVNRINPTQCTVEFDSDGDGEVFIQLYEGINGMGGFQPTFGAGHFSTTLAVGTADSVEITVQDASHALIYDPTKLAIPAYVPPAATKDITSLTLSGVTGTITGTDIAVPLPFGTDMTALTPVIAHSGASISPTGAQDFSTPVAYTVTAADMSTKTYTVTIAVAPASSAKDITSFALAGQAGTISGTNITVTVPYGIDVTALTPAIGHAGTGISPNGVQDFTNPVSYTITAQDGSTKTYTATVAVSTDIPVMTHFGTWTGGGGTATSKVDAPLAKFVRLTLDGVELTVTDYDAVEGSTIITLTEHYLKTLTNGDYTLFAEFTDGTAAMQLKVAVPEEDATSQPATPTSGGTNLPRTGDFALPLVWAAMLALSGIALLLLSQRRCLVNLFRK